MNETRRRLCGTLAIGLSTLVSGCLAQEESAAEPSVSISAGFEGAIDPDESGSIADIRVGFAELQLDWEALAAPVSAILLGVDTEYGRLLETAYEGSWSATGELRDAPGEYSLLDRTEATAEDVLGSSGGTLELDVFVQLFDADEERLGSASTNEILELVTDASSGEGDGVERRVLITVMDLFSSRLEDAPVRVYRQGDANAPVAEAETDEEGRARFELVEGSYRIEADHEDHRPATISLDLRGEDQSLVFMLEPEREAGDDERGDGDDRGPPGDESDGPGVDEDRDDDDENRDDEEDGGDGNGDDDDGDDEDDGDGNGDDDDGDDEDVGNGNGDDDDDAAGDDEEDDDDGFIFQRSATDDDGHDGI